MGIRSNQQDIFLRGYSLVKENFKRRSPKTSERKGEGGRNGTEILIDTREKDGKWVELKKKLKKNERNKLSIFPERPNLHVRPYVTNRSSDVAPMFRGLSASTHGNCELC